MENRYIILQAFNKLHGYFEYLSPKNELKDFYGAKQQVFAEEIANSKTAATPVNVKRVQIPVSHGMLDFQIQDKVRSIIKSKIDSENNTQDEEELLPGNLLSIFM